MNTNRMWSAWFECKIWSATNTHNFIELWDFDFWLKFYAGQLYNFFKKQKKNSSKLYSLVFWVRITDSIVHDLAWPPKLQQLYSFHFRCAESRKTLNENIQEIWYCVNYCVSRHDDFTTQFLCDFCIWCHWSAFFGIFRLIFATVCLQQHNNSVNVWSISKNHR